MLSQYLTGAVNRRLREEIPNSALLPYGGVWGQRVPDVDATHDELTEIDTNVSVAANILAQGATNPDTTDLPTALVVDRAFRIKQSRRFGQPDVQAVIRLNAAQNSPLIRQEFLNRIRTKDRKNLEGVQITRGVLCAACAQGLFDYSHFGFINSNTDWGMPNELRIDTGTAIQNADGSVDTAGRFLAGLRAADRQAQKFSATPFTDVDMDYAAFEAMLKTDEYKNEALRSTAYLSLASLPAPTANNPTAIEVAQRVVGKRINLVEDEYRVESGSGSFAAKRFTSTNYAVLWRAGNVGIEFKNVEVTETGIALVGDDPRFGGQILRGPLTYASCEKDELTNARRHAVQEGVPVRTFRAATARILVRDLA